MLKAKPKFFFASIHKPLAATWFGITISVLAVTVEPFLFSFRRGGVAYDTNGFKLDCGRAKKDKIGQIALGDLTLLKIRIEIFHPQFCGR